MTYTLLFIVLLADKIYITDRGLSLQECAGRAAMNRSEYLAAGLVQKIGEVRYVCVAEHEGGR